MPARLYVVHGSHPCATVEEALKRKGMAYKTVEFPPPMHAALMPLFFGGRTVPGIKFEGGEKVQGSRAILRRLEELRPDPPLYGSTAQERARIEEAELWGDEVLQPIARRLLWPAFQKDPAAMQGYQEGGKLPPMPVPVLKAMAPVATRIERRLNAATDEAARGDLRAMPAHLDRVDGWIAEGVLGGDEPNAADLQIAPTLRLLHSIGDVRPLFEGRPAAALAHKWLSPLQGSTPAGLLPA
jgi:glutathione S-transferase